MSGLTLSFISFVRRPVSSLLAVISLIIPLVAVGLAITLLVNFRESIQKYDTSVHAILGPKTPDHEIILSSLFGVGHVDQIIPYGLIDHARKPLKKKDWELNRTFGDDTVNVVKQATPFMEFAEYNGYKVIGTDNSFLVRPEKNMNCPKVSRGTWFHNKGQVVAGSLVAQKENLSPGSTITADSKLLHPYTGQPLWRKNLTVTGILEPTNIVYDRMLHHSR